LASIFNLSIIFLSLIFLIVIHMDRNCHILRYWLSLCKIVRSSVILLLPLFSSTNKADRHDIPEILLKVVFNTITPILTPTQFLIQSLTYRSGLSILYCPFGILSRLLCPVWPCLWIVYSWLPLRYSLTFITYLVYYIL
jgi:hypothetical protein